jgi:glyceraldehyde 3-phosphate dehydrogenase
MNIVLNGFGRIGRILLRNIIKHDRFCVKAINDIDSNTENHAYLFKYDSTHGKYEGNVQTSGNCIILDQDYTIPFYAQSNIYDLPWDNLNVDLVIDASGVYQNVLSLNKLVEENLINKAIVTHSPKDNVDATFVMGVNESCYNPAKHNVISSSICDVNANSLILNYLNLKFGIESCFITTLHPWLSYQNLLDGSVRSISNPGHFWQDFALGRASLNNLIPKKTSLVDALVKVIPELSGKIRAFSYRIPTTIVCSSDLNIILKKKITKNVIQNSLNELSDILPSYISLNSESLTSIDFSGSCESVIVDKRWVEVDESNNFLKLILWYDNEWGYCNRVIDLAKHIWS